VQLPLTIPLYRSWRLISLLALAHGAALAVLWPLALPAVAKFALGIAVSGSAYLFVERTWRHRIRSLRLGARGEIEIGTKVGAGETAIVLPQSTVLPGLIVLLLRVGGRREWLVLPPDATGTAAHRQLRLWLRWQA
jgi:hypothetical protein